MREGVEQQILPKGSPGIGSREKKRESRYGCDSIRVVSQTKRPNKQTQTRMLTAPRESQRFSRGKLCEKYDSIHSHEESTPGPQTLTGNAQQTPHYTISRS